MKETGDYSLTQSAGIVGASKFVNILGLLAASMILTRLLSRAEYGNYEQVWLVYNSFLPLVAYGLSSSIYFFSAREDKRSVYSAALIWVAVAGILTGIVLAIVAPLVARWFKADALTEYIRIFAVYAVVASPSLMFESVFVNEKKVGLLLAGNVLVSVLFAGGVLLSALVFRSLTVVFISVTLVGVVKSLFLLAFLMRRRRLASEKISPIMKAQLFYALPILVSSITGTVSKQIDRYLVTLFFSPDQFAIYAIGSKELPMIAVITGSASAVLFPVFSEFGSKEASEKFIEVWRNSVSKTGLFLLPMMIFLLFAAKDFMHFFFGEKYIVSSAIFRIFLLLLPLRLAFYSQALLSLGKQKLYMYTTLAELLLSAGASYILLRIYGLEGAAVGKVLVSYVEVFFLGAVLIVLLKTNPGEFLPWLKIVKILLISAVGVIPPFLIRSYVPNVYLRFIVEAGVFAIVFVTMAIVTKSVRIVDPKKLRFVVN